MANLKDVIQELESTLTKLKDATIAPPKTLHINHLGEEVKKARKARNMSQKSLAEITGLNVKTIAKLENGDLSLSMDSVLTITKAIGVEICIR